MNDDVSMKEIGSDKEVASLRSIWGELTRSAMHAGALRIGASAIDDEHVELFGQWLERKLEGQMHYLRRSEAVRRDPLQRFPWARSVIVITVPYSPNRPSAPDGALSNHMARYALGDDYHEVLDAILCRIEETLRQLVPEVSSRRYVDTGPLSDRSYAAQAGLGWIGRSGMLIDERNGSYFLIGTLLTSLENDLSPELVADRCGTCTRCVDACPTAAILPDRLVDSQRCISHATIETRGAIDDWMKSRLEGNVFGCDICQEVCPWNRFAPAGHESFEPREQYRSTPVTDLLRMDQAQFSTMFRRSAAKRAKRAGMIRNALLISDVPTEELERVASETDSGILDAVQWKRV
ncbi:MAG: tRNA epoxyqueuosine(34) reductase QueG [Acidobacteriota bacterium]